MYNSAAPASNASAVAPSSAGFYPDPSNPYLQFSPAPSNRPVDPLTQLGRSIEGAAKIAETVIGNVYNHLRTGPSMVDVAAARLAQGTKVLAEGGCEKIFWQVFGALPAEKLKKAYVCYLSTSSGPVMGTLYVSTNRIAFFSDYPLMRQRTDYWYSPESGRQGEWVYQKLVVMVEDLIAVDATANRSNPSEKYIQILTRDGHEFWFMGFVSYDKALNSLQEAIQYTN
ncbi:hypothetical protein Nepgr_013913 [Nepenthes gracilis]|uniref:GRAM domain-containing protein n=1 Tax=Nepenthes gracilis TaxID=150966 RepID=A0AAD3XP25_NEPGR|nr:hypothetical protein Nepgr_013913 [Nepenthes gracilis]